MLFIRHILLSILCGAGMQAIAAPEQYNPDSLLRVIQSTDLPDSSRMRAMHKYSEYLIDRDLDKAFYYAQEALRLAEAGGHNKFRNTIRANFATIHKYKGDFKTADSLYLLVLNEHFDTKDSVGIAGIYGHLGTLYQAMRRNQMAIQYLLKALQIHALIKSSPYQIAATLNNIGNVYFTEKKYRRALEYYDKATLVNKPNKFFKWLCINYLNMGNCYAELNVPDSAMNCFNLSLSIAQQKQLHWVCAADYEGMGNVALSLQQFEQALAYFTTAREYADKAKNPELLLYTFAGTAEALSGLQEHRQAQTLWKAIIDSTEKYNFPMLRAELLVLGGRIFSASGDYKQAAELYKKYAELKDSLFADGNEMMYADFELRLDRELQEQIKQHQQEQEALQQDAALRQSRLQLYAAFVVLILVVIAGFIAYRGYRQKKKSHEEIVFQKSLVDEKNREILDSINYAKRLQSAILPSHSEIQSAFKDVFVLYRPKDIVAGDFYFFEEHRGYRFIAVADCTGHGVPGAMVSVVCANALQRAIQEHELNEPGQILDKVNHLVESTFAKSAYGVRDGMDISLCVFNSSSGEVCWAGANLSLVICINGELQEIKGNKQPVGKFDERQPFTTHRIIPPAGSMMYMFSDGYADQFGGPDAKKLKSKNLKNLLLTHSSLDATEQHQHLSDFLTTWQGSLEQIDDVCVIGLRV